MTQNKIKNKFLQTAVLLLSVATFQTQVFANSLVVSTVKNPNTENGNQSWFIYKSNAGSTIKDILILQNLGDKTEDISLYATDATVNQSGSFLPKNQHEEQKTIGLWTKLEQNLITIKPGEVIELPFTIEIPKNANPGQYFGGIIKEDPTNTDCQTQPIKEGQCIGNIQVKTRTGNRIYINIPGESIPNITLTKFTQDQNRADQTTFHFTFENQGNISFEPKALIKIYDQWGNKITTIEKILGQSLPQTTIHPSLTWNHQGQFGQFTVKAEISYLQNNFSSFKNLHGSALSDYQEIKVTLIPWFNLLLISFILALIFSCFYGKHLYFKKLLANSRSYQVQTDENLLDIAEKFDVNWKKLAKLNQLKAPYVLKNNQIIKIPQQKQK